MVRVVPGAQIPADGTVVRGESHVDESLLTGESCPVLKSPGSRVSGGTLNLSGGSLTVRAQRVGSLTALGQVIRLVEAAQRTKAPIQRFADTVLYRTVPSCTIALVSGGAFRVLSQG